jgi:hypothetical protein
MEALVREKIGDLEGWKLGKARPNYCFENNAQARIPTNVVW